MILNRCDKILGVNSSKKGLPDRILKDLLLYKDYNVRHLHVTVEQLAKLLSINFNNPPSSYDDKRFDRIYEKFFVLWELFWL